MPEVHRPSSSTVGEYCLRARWLSVGCLELGLVVCWLWVIISWLLGVGLGVCDSGLLGEYDWLCSF